MPAILGYRDAAQAMQDQFRTAWNVSSYATGTPPVPLFFDNEMGLDPANEINFVTFAVVPGKAIQVAICGLGFRRWRQYGQIIISVYYGMGKGTSFPEILGDFVAAVFRGTSAGSGIGGVIMKAPRLERVGLIGTHYRHNIVTDFQFDIRA